MRPQVLAALTIACGVARAEPATEEKPLTADDVRDAPRPGDEHGRRDPLDPGDSATRKVVRAALWVPRVPFELIAIPVRNMIEVQERHDLIHTVEKPFTTEDRRVSFLPTALVTSDWGVELGMRATFQNLLDKERIIGRAAFGGEARRLVAFDIDSGPARTLRAGLDVRYELRDKDRFYGYGNGDEISTEAPPMPVDPLTNETAISTRYRTTLSRVAPRLRYTPVRPLTFTLTGALLDQSFATTDAQDGLPIDQGYMTDQLPGFDDGSRAVYTELEIAVDTRRQAHLYDPAPMHADGGYAAVYGGREHSLTQQMDYYRVGTDLQRYIPLTAGPRALQLRFVGEMVTGDRNDVPFTELPTLGGFDLLRGYPTGRFRDRVAAVGQLSYLWAIGPYVGARVFGDVGRVYSGLDELTLDGLRAGFGAGLDCFSRSKWVVRVQVAASIDHDAVGSIGFGHALDGRTRVERK